MPAGGAIASGVAGAISLISGLLKSKKAKQLEKENVRPTENIPQGVLDATALAKQQASFGLTSTAKLGAENDIQRAASTAINSSVDRRGGMQTIGAIQQGTVDASNKLAVEDANAKTAKQGQLITQENQLGGWQDKVWDWNSRQKFEENAAAIRALKGAAAEETNTAENQLLGGLVKFGAQGGFGAKNAEKINNSPTDPTLTNPDLYGNGIPSSYADYKANLERLRRFSGPFQSAF